jgi:cell pole-organizing protein PopZ
MPDKTPDQEPSIEEILASIRQIISDDEDKDPPVEAAPEPPKAAAPPPPPPLEPAIFKQEEPEEDILELTDAVPEEAPELEPEEIEVEMFDMPEEEPVAAAPPSPTQPVTTPAPVDADDILTEAARQATMASMAKLAGNMPITRHREFGNITLEDLVREMLHPMLKDWLSQNLPGMVERLVQKELEKLARRAHDV